MPRGLAYKEVCLWGGELCIPGEGVGLGCGGVGGWAEPPPTRKAGGAHPTGILSCCLKYFVIFVLLDVFF